MFDKLLADYVDQLTLLEDQNFGPTFEIEDETFTKLEGLGLIDEIACAIWDVSTTALDESCFAPLDEGAFVELDKL